MIHPEHDDETILRTKLPDCEGCPMRCVNVRVPPELPPDLRVLVVGEAPGMGDLDRPFSGKAGQFIRDVLRHAGLIRGVGLDNVVKCRRFELVDGRPEIQDPRKSDVDHCRSQLEALLKERRPRVVVALGASALSWFVEGATSVAHARGRLYKTKYGAVMPTFNPAAVFRTGDHLMLDQIRGDLVRVAAYLRGEPAASQTDVTDVRWVVPGASDARLLRLACEPPRDHGVTSMRRSGTTTFVREQDALDSLVGVETAVVDLETTGLDPYAEDADVTVASIATSETSALVVPVAHRDVEQSSGPHWRRSTYDLLLRLLAVPRRLSFHNAEFDYRYLRVTSRRVLGVEWNPVEVEDTLLMHFLCYPNSSHSLENILNAAGQHPHKEWVVEWFRSRKLKPSDGWSRVDLWLLGAYNAADAARTYWLRQRLAETLARRPHLAEFWRSRLSRVARAVWDMRLAGVAVNPEAFGAARAYFTKQIREAQREVLYNPLVLRHIVEVSGWPMDAPMTIDSLVEHGLNLGSPMQLSRLLFGDVAETSRGRSIHDEKDADYKRRLRRLGHGKRRGESDEEWMTRAMDTGAPPKRTVSEDDESTGLGVDRSLSRRNANGYSTDGDVLSGVVGSDWPVFKAESSLSSTRTVERDGEDVSDVRIGAEELTREYLRLVRADVPVEDVSRKLRPVAARSVADSLRTYRTADKWLSTYVDAVQSKWISTDGLIHPDVKVHGTVTGRQSSFFHTVPRASKVLKRQFRSRHGEQGRLVGADLGQIEARVAASLSGDEKFLSIFREGLDLHREVAARFLRIPFADVTREQRHYVKQIHFGTIYRRTPQSLASDLVNTGMQHGQALEFAARFIDSYFEDFRTLYEWRDRLVSDVRRLGVTVASESQRRRRAWSGLRSDPLNYLVVSPFGRELHIPRGSTNWDLMSHTCNYPIQSAAADVLSSTLVSVTDRLRSEAERSVVVLTIHDALYVDAHVEELDVVVGVLSEEMTRDDDYRRDWLHCSLTSDVSVGLTWGDMESIQTSDMAEGRRLVAGTEATL